MKVPVKAYDLDGVIAPKREPWWLSILWWIFPRLASHITVWLIRNKGPLLIPPRNALIITGRGGQLRTATVKWLARNGIFNELIMIRSSHTNRYLARNWKWVQCVKRGVDIFYEDDPKTINELETIEGLEVVRINHGEKSI
jgi:hypothetical protein